MRSLGHQIYASRDMRPSSFPFKTGNHFRSIINRAGLLFVQLGTPFKVQLPACIHNFMFCFVFLVFWLAGRALASSQWIEYSDSGYATMTHYTMAPGYIASCGCTGASTGYPTAALSQMAYGSSTNYGAPFFTLFSCPCIEHPELQDPHVAGVLN